MHRVRRFFVEFEESGEPDWESLGPLCDLLKELDDDSGLVETLEWMVEHQRWPLKTATGKFALSGPWLPTPDGQSRETDQHIIYGESCLQWSTEKDNWIESVWDLGYHMGLLASNPAPSIFIRGSERVSE